MAPGPRNLSVSQRDSIVRLRKDGLSFREISKKTGFALSTLHKTWKGFCETDSNLSRLRSGRKKILTDSDHNYIALLSSRDRKKTCAQITEEFNYGRCRSVSHSTVRKVLLKWNMRGRVAAKKPLLRKQNVAKRLSFAKKHVKWSKKQWAKVLFSDESKFKMFGTKRRVFVRRKKRERFDRNCVLPSIKHGGGSIMVWGGISVKGALPLKRIEGIMDAKMYHGILVNHAMKGGKNCLEEKNSSSKKITTRNIRPKSIENI